MSCRVLWSKTTSPKRSSSPATTAARLATKSTCATRCRPTSRSRTTAQSTSTGRTSCRTHRTSTDSTQCLMASHIFTKLWTRSHASSVAKTDTLQTSVPRECSPFFLIQAESDPIGSRRCPERFNLVVVTTLRVAENCFYFMTKGPFVYNTVRLNHSICLCQIHLTKFRFIQFTRVILNDPGLKNCP